MTDKNNSIGCSVSECKFHAQNTNYCTLDKIMVVRTEQVSSCSRDTGCESFVPKSDSMR